MSITKGSVDRHTRIIVTVAGKEEKFFSVFNFHSYDGLEINLRKVCEFWCLKLNALEFDISTNFEDASPRGRGGKGAAR